MTNETEVERWTRLVAGAEAEVSRYQQDGPREHIREARDALDDARISLVRAKKAEAAKQPGLRLKPCPFCGGPAQIERFGNTRVSTIYACDECGCRLETATGRSTAIAAVRLSFGTGRPLQAVFRSDSDNVIPCVELCVAKSWRCHYVPAPQATALGTVP